MKIILTFISFLFYIFSTFGQSNYSNPIYNDSIKLDYLSNDVKSFDLLAPMTPLTLFKEGIFLLKEKMWYYQLPKSFSIADFNYAPLDTSLYLIVQSKVQSKLFNLKIDPNSNDEIKTELVTIDRNTKSMVFSAGRQQCYLLVMDSISTLYFINNTTQTTIFKTRDKLRSIIPLDATSFITYTTREILFISNGHNPLILFSSKEDLIISAVVDFNGTLIISTSKGVFTIKNKSDLVLIDGTIKDGYLKLLDRKLYILSNKRKVIYVKNL